jgi:hypothetical protein
VKLVASDRRFLYDLLRAMKCVACRCVLHLKVVGLPTLRNNLLLLAENLFHLDGTGGTVVFALKLHFSYSKKKIRVFHLFSIKACW